MAEIEVKGTFNAQAFFTALAAILSKREQVKITVTVNLVVLGFQICRHRQPSSLFCLPSMNKRISGKCETHYFKTAVVQNIVSQLPG